MDGWNTWKEQRGGPLFGADLSGADLAGANLPVVDFSSTGLKEANLYGADDDVYGGLNAFFLLMDEPEAYNLPNTANAVLPSRNNIGGYLGAAVTAVLGLVGTVIALRQRRQGGGDATETPEEARP